ncbi:MAG: hypothetical protein HC809_16800, partial [Gammaproteobacteria bacterium]|nr:hypothetical protein [Gammaproteobacteria bacterium]
MGSPMPLEERALTGKRILLGITGGIAAYKTPALVRELIKAGADVQVVMTRAAHRFVTATSLQAVSLRPVRDDLWDPAAEASMGHIELARWADLVLVAPATANCLAKLAVGIADDLLTTLALATQSPIALAPAMNQRMWLHPATQRSVARLVEDGVTVLGPGAGDLACGGDPFAPTCVVRCPDAADGIQIGDQLDGDRRIDNGCECEVTSLDDVGGDQAAADDLDANCDGADGNVLASLYVAT